MDVVKFWTRKWMNEWTPFATEIQDDLWVEADGPWYESQPSQKFICDFQRNRIPRRHLGFLSANWIPHSAGERDWRRRKGLSFLCSIIPSLTVSCGWAHLMTCPACDWCFLQLQRLWMEAILKATFIHFLKNTVLFCDDGYGYEVNLVMFFNLQGDNGIILYLINLKH